MLISSVSGSHVRPWKVSIIRRHFLAAMVCARREIYFIKRDLDLDNSEDEQGQVDTTIATMPFPRYFFFLYVQANSLNLPSPTLGSADLAAATRTALTASGPDAASILFLSSTTSSASSAEKSKSSSAKHASTVAGAGDVPATVK